MGYPPHSNENKRKLFAYYNEIYHNIRKLSCQAKCK